MPIVARVIGGVAIVVLSFFATLYFLDYLAAPRNSADAIRASTAKAVMAALEKYRAAKGSYPIIPDAPLSSLAPALVGGGFLTAIPPDPPGKEETRYASFDGTVYALHLIFDRDGRPCIAEPVKTEWWGGLSPCQL
jgi:hypothetical protein